MVAEAVVVLVAADIAVVAVVLAGEEHQAHGNKNRYNSNCN